MLLSHLRTGTRNCSNPCHQPPMASLSLGPKKPLLVFCLSPVCANTCLRLV